MRGDDVAAADPGIDPQSRPSDRGRGLELGVRSGPPGETGEVEAVEPAGLRQVVGRGVLGVEARLDRVAYGLDPVRLGRQLLAERDQQLQPDEVESGDHLGHRVLDLKARVHLEEEELAVRCQQELDRAGADVVDRLGRGDRRLAHPAAQLAIDGGRGRLLDHLLVAALDRALALTEADRVAVKVGEDLDLDVPGTLEQALEEHRPVAERGLGLAPGAVDRAGRAHPARGPSASPCRRRRPTP